MIEADWLAETNPAYLFREVRACPRRKQCLFECACWASARDLLISEESRAALRRLEIYADSDLCFDTLESVRGVNLSIAPYEVERAMSAPFVLELSRLRLQAAALAVAAAGEKWQRVEEELEETSNRAVAAWRKLGRGLCDLGHCVFGNPFRPTPAIARAWLAWNGGTVRKLAESAYAEYFLPERTLEPARLKVLADALEDAGCTERDLLGHLRAPGPHVRGCWALDLVLAKE
jgi:hypothetical protein